MKTTTIDWILKCIDPQYFQYEKGQYVQNILQIALTKEELTKNDLLASPFGFLMNKPEIKTLTKNIGSGVLTKSKLSVDNNGKYFKLSVSKWGESKSHRNDSYYQTSCPGKNLVLQLNFDLEHDLLYHQTFDVKEDGHNFTNSGHPISEKANTMAWSRIDVDLETGEAFIEEIQNDWLREVLDVHKEFKKKKEKKKEHWITAYTKGDKFEKYATHIKPYNAYWSEAMLMAAIDFIVNELGITKVYYHTYESGNYFKKLPEYSRPPRSLYTKLPKRFGFKETQQPPEFWKNNNYMKKRINQYQGNFYCFDYAN